MLESDLYYIYIDTKIKGTIEQLIDYFQADVFNANACVCIYFKYYKEIEKYIVKAFAQKKILFKFIKKNSDLVLIPNKVVFYLFNAQSNCKLVARRDLTHIFVTHGESHKLASIKPIIRIYDFVISSGQVGIERYLKAGIFNQQDIEFSNKVIPMGNTFIGQHHYIYQKTADAYLYAPTWEGGVPNENYSSLGLGIQSALITCLQQNSIRTLYLQPHPNLGHRDQSYRHRLLALIADLKKSKIQVKIVKSRITLTDYWYFKGCELIPKYQMDMHIAGAIVDISAMEMQLIHSHIPTDVIYSIDALNNLIIPKKISALYSADYAVSAPQSVVLDVQRRLKMIEQQYDYLISYYDESLQVMTFKQRIEWLCTFTTQQRLQQSLQSSERY